MAIGITDWHNVPTSSVHQSRLQIFQPTRRPTDVSREIDTPWGSATITGKVGQVHADLVECVGKCAEDFRTDNEGRLHVLVDPHKVRKMMAGNEAGDRYGMVQIKTLAQDMRRTVIHLRATKFKTFIIDGILDRIEESPMTVKSHNGKDRQLWRVIFSATFTMMLEQDFLMYYDPAPIARLNTGIAQALARHVLTHEKQPNGGWKLDSLLQAVGVDVNKGAMLRKRRLEVRSDKDGLKDIGIIIDDDRVYTET